MVKQAEKRRTRSPFLPVLGLFLAIVLLAVSFAAAQMLGQITAVKTVLGGLPYVKIFGQSVNEGVLMLMFVIWLAFLALAYFLVAVLAGKDPDSAKNIPMPPRDRRRKKID